MLSDQPGDLMHNPRSEAGSLTDPALLSSLQALKTCTNLKFEFYQEAAAAAAASGSGTPAAAGHVSIHIAALQLQQLAEQYAGDDHAIMKHLVAQYSVPEQHRWGPRHHPWDTHTLDRARTEGRQGLRF